MFLLIDKDVAAFGVSAVPLAVKHFFWWPHAREERHRCGTCGPQHSGDLNHNPSPTHLEIPQC